MIEVTAIQFAQNPIHMQALAQKEPVVVGEGVQKQVLMNYDDYQELIKMGENQSPKNTHEFLAQMMSGLTDEQQEHLANAGVEFDMSFLERR